MAIVQGLGGAFLYARDPHALAGWYREHLGLPSTEWGDSVFCELPGLDVEPSERGSNTVWALLPADDRFAPGALRLDYRVSDLDALVARLGDAVYRRFEDENGRFAWVDDPAGNRVELVEARARAVPAFAPDERAFRVQGLGGAFLYTDDPEALVAWYREYLGLEPQKWGDRVWGTELPSADRAPSRRIATTTWALFGRDSDTPDVACHGRLNYRVDDLDAALAHFEGRGDRVEQLDDEGYGRFATVWDPEGNRVELWEPPLG